MNNENQDKWNSAYLAGRDYSPVSTSDIQIIVNNVPLNGAMSALDIGCGTGQLCRELYHMGFSCTGLDVSEAALDIAEKSTVKSITFIHGDITSTKLSGHMPFNLIVTRYVLAFITDRELFYTKVLTLLDDNGTFIVINPNIDMLPPEKKNITIPDDLMMNELAKRFKVKKIINGKDIYYFCTKM